MKHQRHYYVYILTNKIDTVLYTGVTNNIYRRLHEHQSKRNPTSFTARYNVHKLVYIETTNSILTAIAREKQIKGWLREKKEELIRSTNPAWKDLIEDSREYRDSSLRSE